MDRSLNGDDLRNLENLTRRPASRWTPALALDGLPGWFRRVVAEQSAWLGLEPAGALRREAAPAVDRPRAA
jgi:hypothetical protein